MQVTNRYRFVIWAFILVGQLTMAMPYMCISPLFPRIMDEFQIDRPTVSLLISSIGLILVIGTIPGGMLAGRIGLKRAFGIGSLLMGAGVFTRFTYSFTALLITRIIFGIGIALRFPSIAGLVMQWFRGKELTIVNATSVIGASVGISIGMFLVPRLADSVGWKTSLTIFGVTLLMTAIAWLFLGREQASQNGSRPPDETSSAVKMGIGSILKHRVTWMLALAGVGPHALYVALNSWLPSYYTEVFNMPLSAAGSVVGVFNLLGIPASILGGILPIRARTRKPFLIVPGIIVGFAGFGSFLFNNTLVIYSSVIILGMCVWIFWPTLITIPMELPQMTPHSIAVVIAIVMTTTNLATFVIPPLVGYLVDATGSYVPGFSIAALLSWSLLIGGLLLPETGSAANHKR